MNGNRSLLFDNTKRAFLLPKEKKRNVFFCGVEKFLNTINTKKTDNAVPFRIFLNFRLA